MKFPLYPEHRDLIGHTIVAEGKSPRIKHIVVFSYPDGVRAYDGKEWRAIPKAPPVMLPNPFGGPDLPAPTPV